MTVNPAFIFKKATLASLALLFVLSACARSIRVQAGDPVSIEQFGAQPNNPNFDNAPAIIKALQSAKSVLFPANKTYYIASAIKVNGLTGVTIYAKASTIINTNYDAQTFLFIGCSSIAIESGHYTRDVIPTKQDGKNQHMIEFRNCNNVSISHAHIERSPEMGICNNCVNGGVYTSNTIEHCLRDGIYAHYSVNLKYIANTVSDIKDDGLSMHDYGIDAQKTFIKQAGYSQAGHSVISGNNVSNCVEGISSIGCTDVTISGNVVRNTLMAGISMFDSEDLLPHSNARVNNVRVLNNVLDNNNSVQNIAGQSFNPGAFYANGRSAIFIGCVKGGGSYTVSKMRLSSVTVQGNAVSNCATNGATLYNIDSLVFSGNKFFNCHSSANTSTGDIIEIQNCTNIQVYNNEVTDTRGTLLHNRGYAVDNSSGTFQQGKVNGFRIEAVSVKNSPELTKQ
jgi:parallel beta-helix repeat protein